MHRIDHGDDILDRSGRLNIVNTVEDESAARREDLAPAQNLLPDFCCRAEGKNPLRIHSSAPKYEPIAKVCFQLLWLHSGGGALDWIKYVESSFDKGGEKLED